MHRNLYGVCPVHRPERKIISRIRTKIKDNAETLAHMGVEETGMGNAGGLMHWAMSAVLPLRGQRSIRSSKERSSYAALGFAMSLR